MRDKDQITRKIARYCLIAILMILLLSSGAIYIIYTSNSTGDRWQALWSNANSSNLPICLDPNKVIPPYPPYSLKHVTFKPFRLIVEPWRGEHNVYAVFAVPLAYYEIYYRSLMLVEGTKKGWEATIADAKGMRLEPPEGHFLMVSFFPTRLAIWYWLTGKFANLQDPCNWTLYIYP